MTQTAYLAAPGYEELLARELGDVAATHGRLFVAPGPARPASWALNVWHEPRTIPISSIGSGARALRALQRNWVLYPTGHHRRASLIQEQLPHVSAHPVLFPEPRPTAPLGSWTLLDKDTILAAPRCSSPFPNGEVHFVEDREAPPSRAYLKLWEAFTLLDGRPGPGDVCVDLGSSPGGWTWVLQQLGSDVISVDKAPLDATIAALPRVRSLRESAFGLAPESLGHVDWMLCDVACYPERLLGLVQRWLDSGVCGRFVCTVKLQGAADTDVLEHFGAIAGSRLVHLFHNKHELTWVRLGAPAPRSGAASRQERGAPLELEIERARPGQAGEISTLVCGLASAFTLRPDGEGAETFLASLAPDAIEATIRDPRYAYYAGRLDGRLAGVVALRDEDHLFHLFVAPELHGRGIGRRLWERARTDALASGNRSGFTVNSTPGAVRIYERFGFRATGPLVESDGIAYVPMRLDLDAHSPGGA